MKVAFYSRGGRPPPVSQADQDQRRVSKREQLTETALCGYIEGLGKMDAPYAELEPHPLLIGNPFRGEDRAASGFVNFTDAEF